MKRWRPNERDLRLTAELCLLPGMLADKLQSCYSVIRNGEEYLVPRALLTKEEITVISIALCKLAEGDTGAKSLEVLGP